jgi:NADPH:quinone reductase
MRAVRLTDGEVLVGDVPQPVPAESELLVAVRAAGLNGADMIQWRASREGPARGASFGPGLEFAGEVIGAGAGVKDFAAGDRVMGIVPAGGQAEIVAIDAKQAIRIPVDFDPVLAGAIPEATFAAYDALSRQAAVRPGDHVLVHGAAGGVGCAAVQLAKLLGAEVTASVRRAAHREAMAEMGADRVTDEASFGEAGPFDVVIELVGAPNFPANIDALAERGRIVVVGVAAGDEIALNLRALMSKRGTLRGSTLRMVPADEKRALAREFRAAILPAVLDGSIAIPIARSFGLDEAPDAYRAFRDGGKLGKIVLVP